MPMMPVMPWWDGYIQQLSGFAELCSRDFSSETANPCLKSSFILPASESFGFLNPKRSPLIKYRVKVRQVGLTE